MNLDLKNPRFAVISLVFATLACSIFTADARERPNFVLILADDLGFSDLGCQGGEIQTPNLDSLAERGLRFTQFYNTARCWPSRAAILTGYYAQQVRRDKLPGIRSGGRGKRPAWAPLLPKLLKAHGYRSYHCGKWHVDGMPLQNGFDRSYYLKDQGRFFNPEIHWEDDKKLPAVPPGTDYYGTTAVAGKAVTYLRSHAKDHGQQPFFLYLAFAAPHFPLHALPEDIAKYRERYNIGWDKIREERWKSIQKLGIIDNAILSEVERDLGPPYHFPDALETLGPAETNRPLPWEALDRRQKEFQAVKMSIHAAMIDRMDQEIGRVIEQLKAMNQFENTLIVFLSDNGASAEIMVRADGHDPEAPPGSASTYLCLGPGWSTVCNTPFRKHKTWVHEGGITTPLLAHWPVGIKARGELRRSVGHVIDFVPTFLELASGRPEIADAKYPRPGKSLVPIFESDGGTDRELWWSHEENNGLRKGDLKLVATKGGPWELYDLSKDRNETNDLAKVNPKRVSELATTWETHLSNFIEQAKPEPGSR